VSLTYVPTVAADPDVEHVLDPDDISACPFAEACEVCYGRDLLTRVSASTTVGLVRLPVCKVHVYGPAPRLPLPTRPAGLRALRPPWGPTWTRSRPRRPPGKRGIYKGRREHGTRWCVAEGSDSDPGFPYGCWRQWAAAKSDPAARSPAASIRNKETTPSVSGTRR
jgi:hypothetical protein